MSQRNSHVCRRNSAYAFVAGTTLLATASSSIAAPTAARSADHFVDSIGICGQIPSDKYTTVKQRLVDLGVRHVRDGINDKTVDLANAGIRTTAVASLPVGPIDGAGNPIGAAYNGSITDIQNFVNNVKQKNTEAGGEGKAIEAIEGPNEPDLFWHTWYNCVYKGQGHPNGPVEMQKDLYNTLKADSQTDSLTVLGPALGGTPSYGTNPWAANALSPYVDWGNFHAYPGGNTFSNPEVYGTIPKYRWQGTHPSNKLDYAFATFRSPFGTTKPFATTETGYYTGTAKGGVNHNVLAKYVPRLFLEHYLAGVARTFYYVSTDKSTNTSSPDENRGLLNVDATPKAAYTALKSLVSLLKEGTFNSTTKNWSTPSFTPGTLDYSLSVSAVNNYKEPVSGVTTNFDKTNNVHHLLLQKSNGEYYLVLWHEIANSAYVDANGNEVSGTSREIQPPALPTTISFSNYNVSGATLYSYDSNWEYQSAALTVSNNTVSLSVPDKAVVLKLTGAVPSNPNLVSNPSFDAENYDTQTPSGWSEAGNNVNANYSESNGGSKSGARHGSHWASSAYTAYTYQTKTGLSNGLYTLRVWGRSGGGQSSCYLEAKDFGGTARTANLPVASAYTLVEIRDINVTNGQITIGVYSNAAAGNWCYFDDFELRRQTTAVPIGQRIGFKAWNNKYVSTNLNNSSYLQASWADGIGGWEKFDVVDAGGGLVALKSVASGKYVTADINSTDKRLRADWSTSIAGWEKFTWQDLGNNIFGLKSAANNKFISTDLNTTEKYVKAQWADSIGDWEKFQWVASP